MGAISEFGAMGYRNEGQHKKVLPLSGAALIKNELQRVYGKHPELKTVSKAWLVERGYTHGEIPVAGVLWEGGPYDWAVEVSMGAKDEYGHDWYAFYEKIHAAGFFTEPWSGWLLMVYEA